MKLINDSIDFDSYLNGTNENANVRPASEYADEVIESFNSQDASVVGCRLPWLKTEEQFRIRTGEVSLWSGFNGSGKSMVLNQVCTSLMKQGQRVCIASMEMLPVSTMKRMSRQTNGSSHPTDDYIRDFHTWTNNKLWLYNQQGTVSSERILGVIRYATVELGVTQFVIDSLMKCGINEDDYNGQKRFIDKLCAVAKDQKCHIHLVVHSRKSQDEKAPPSKMDVKGSGSITDQVDNVWTCWRNKPKELEIETGKASQETKDKPDALLICDKQRHGEWEGRIALWYDKPSFRYKGSQNEKVWSLTLDGK